LKCIYSTYEFN